MGKSFLSVSMFVLSNSSRLRQRSTNTFWCHPKKKFGLTQKFMRLIHKQSLCLEGRTLFGKVNGLEGRTLFGKVNHSVWKVELCLER